MSDNEGPTVLERLEQLERRVATLEARRTGYARGSKHWKVRHGDEVVREAREMREAGLTFRQIAERVGATPTTVHGWVRNHTRAKE